MIEDKEQQNMRRRKLRIARTRTVSIAALSRFQLDWLCCTRYEPSKPLSVLCSEYPTSLSFPFSLSLSIFIQLYLSLLFLYMFVWTVTRVGFFTGSCLVELVTVFLIAIFYIHRCPMIFVNLLAKRSNQNRALLFFSYFFLYFLLSICSPFITITR